MTDEIDLLRSRRPDAAGPTDELIRKERTQFMALVENDQLAARAARRRRFGTRGARLAAAAVAALVVAGGATAASIIVPDDVKENLGITIVGTPLAGEDAGATELSVDGEKAVRRASGSAAGGGTVELWSAPNREGGTCEIIRRLAASGEPAAPGVVRCGTSIGDENVAIGRTDGPSIIQAGTLTSPDGLDARVEAVEGGRSTVYGTAPAGARQVAAVSADGTRTVTEVAAGGWFIVDSPSLVERLDVLDGSGAVVDTVAVEAPELAVDGAIKP